MYVGLLKFFSTTYNFEYQGPKSWARPWCHLTYTRSGRCERACNDLPAYTNTWKHKSEPWSAPRGDSCIGFKKPIEFRCQIGSASIRILINKANKYKAASIKSS